MKFSDGLIFVKFNLPIIELKLIAVGSGALFC